MAVCEYIFDIPLEDIVPLTFPNCIQPANYGLTSFSAILEGIPGVIGSILTLPLTPPLQVRSIYTNGTISIITTPPLPSRVVLKTFNNPQQNPFAVELSSTSRIIVFYQVQYIHKGSQVKITLGTKLAGFGASFVTSGSEIVPNIFASIEPTTDGEQVCT